MKARISIVFATTIAALAVAGGALAAPHQSTAKGSDYMSPAASTGWTSYNPFASAGWTSYDAFAVKPNPTGARSVKPNPWGSRGSLRPNPTSLRGSVHGW